MGWAHTQAAAPRTHSKAPLLSLAGLVVLCLAVGGVGGLATADAVRDWYPTLEKPAWTPPNWLFGPVWTTLYILIGVAGWLVRPTALLGDRRPWRLWWLQLALNAVWSPLFFGAHQLGLAAIDIVALWAVIAAFLLATLSRRPSAFLLFLPYWLWVSYASSLNLGIWLLNR